MKLNRRQIEEIFSVEPLSPAARILLGIILNEVEKPDETPCDETRRKGEAALAGVKHVLTTTGNLIAAIKELRMESQDKDVAEYFRRLGVGNGQETLGLKNAKIAVENLRAGRPIGQGFASDGNA